PAMALAFTLTAGMIVLNEEVIPRFLAEMQRIITIDIANQIFQGVEKGQAVLSHFAFIELDNNGDPAREATAGLATIWLFPPGAPFSAADADPSQASL